MLTIDELLKELDKYKHRELHVHHTWIPNHSHFTGSNYQKMQDGMRNSHLARGFADIAQHVTLFPDGRFMTGRDFGKDPASIKGQNHDLPFCMEMIGDFDKGKDRFDGPQKYSALRLAKYFDDKKRYIRFHRENAPKTCPGTSIDKTEFMWDVRKLGTKPVAAEKPKEAVSKQVLTGGLSLKSLGIISEFIDSKDWWAEARFRKGVNPRIVTGGLDEESLAEFEEWLKAKKWSYKVYNKGKVPAE